MTTTLTTTTTTQNLPSVHVKDGKVYADSRKVAKFFGKWRRMSAVS